MAGKEANRFGELERYASQVKVVADGLITKAHKDHPDVWMQMEAVRILHLCVVGDVDLLSSYISRLPNNRERRLDLLLANYVGVARQQVEDDFFDANHSLLPINPLTDYASGFGLASRLTEKKVGFEDIMSENLSPKVLTGLIFGRLAFLEHHQPQLNHRDKVANIETLTCLLMNRLQAESVSVDTALDLDFLIHQLFANSEENLNVILQIFKRAQEWVSSKVIDKQMLGHQILSSQFQLIPIYNIGSNTQAVKSHLRDIWIQDSKNHLEQWERFLWNSKWDDERVEIANLRWQQLQKYDSSDDPNTRSATTKSTFLVNLSACLPQAKNIGILVNKSMSNLNINSLSNTKDVSAMISLATRAELSDLAKVNQLYSFYGQMRRMIG